MKKLLPLWVAIAALVAGLTPLALGQFIGASPVVKESPVETYLAGKPADVWLLDDELKNHVEGAPPPPGVAGRLTQMNAQVTRLLDGNRDATAFTKEIISELGRRFGRMISSVHQGETLTVFGDDHGQISQELLNERIKLAYVPKKYAEAVAEGVGSMIQYNSSSRIVAIPAIQWPDIPLTASLFHELGHAYRYLVTGANEQRGQRSQEQALEEVEMHELGGAVFDAMTKGGYSALLKRILSRKNVRNPGEVTELLTPEDLSELDALLGLHDASQTPVRMALAQTYLSLGFMWIDSNDPGGATAQKANFYLWYTAPSIR